MSKALVFAALAFGCVSCATPGSLALPTLPDAPDNWHSFTAVTNPRSECPPIEGVYLDPPEIQRAGAKKKFLPKDNNRLYFGFIPFNRARKREFPLGTVAVPRKGFVVRQTEMSDFYFLLINKDATQILEYHFRADEGDFKCHSGRIEFPTLVSYATTEGGSTNFQVRNVLFLDETGALVIQSTRGPYRGSPAKMAREVSYEFFRYARSDEQEK